MARSLGSDRTDVYALSMSYPSDHVSGAQLKSGAFGLSTADAHGNWIKAGNGKFTSGPWNSKYALGTHGVDEAMSTAWAVIDYNGVFAVVNGI
jgi:hypothetical protein